jgi:hypothetical protein
MPLQEGLEIDLRNANLPTKFVRQELSRSDPTPNAADRDREQFCNLSDGIEARYWP